MKFRKVFRGYDPRQVDEFLKTQAESDKMVLQATRERVDQLLDENKRLGEQLDKYRKDSEAISTALVQSQKLAKLLKNDAEKYSEVVLLRAKLFFAAWQAYAQTLVSTLSREELAHFNEIKDKLEKLVYAYDGRNIAGETADLTLSADGKAATTPQANAAANDNSKQNAANADKVANPVKRIRQAADVAIDPKELIHPDKTLEEICADLGLTGGDSTIQLDVPKGDD